MGNVVIFDTSSVRKPRSKPDSPCEITIFPGIRYEYHGPAALPVAASSDRTGSLRVEIAERESV